MPVTSLPRRFSRRTKVTVLAEGEGQVVALVSSGSDSRRQNTVLLPRGPVGAAPGLLKLQGPGADW